MKIKLPTKVQIEELVATKRKFDIAERGTSVISVCVSCSQFMFLSCVFCVVVLFAISCIVVFSLTEKTQTILDEVLKEHESIKGVGSVLLPIDLQAGNVTLKVVPWIGGRIVSMIHKPSGYEWLEGRFETGCYEEYSGSEYRSSGCTEEYQVVRY